MQILTSCITAAFCLCVISAGVVDVEKTVKQVQTILQSNNQLPRLTRDEILGLLNDIRAEDAKSNSASKELAAEIRTSTYKPEENEIHPTAETLLPKNKDYKNYVNTDAITGTEKVESTTKKGEPTVMVVLPYTPRDGSSLQELYTKAPRIKVVPESKIVPKSFKSTTSNEKLRETLKTNSKVANKYKEEFPKELREFLYSHGLKDHPEQDSFLLPLEGFKPLPPPRVVDGTIQLPENILLTYDLIDTGSEQNTAKSGKKTMPAQNFIFEPLHPEVPFELEPSQSESFESVLPLDLPKPRITKSTKKSPNYEPIDYDSIKVIPLGQGPSPVDDERAILESEQAKRQVNATVDVNNNDNNSFIKSEIITTTPQNDIKDAITNAPVDEKAADTVPADSGASISDLEDSFGGAAPVQPGDSELPPPRKNGFYWMLDWNSFLEVGDGDTKVNIRFEPKLGDPQMFLPVTVP